MTAINPMLDYGLLLHRGASKIRPENTIEAVETAAKMGTTWIETDVQLTRDNELVMIHDVKLDRTTNGTGFVALSDLSYIKGLDAGSWMDPKFAGLGVPTLREFIACILENGLNLQLELKEIPGLEKELADRVCEEINEYWPSGSSKLFLSGFSERCLGFLGDSMPEIPRALALVSVPKDPDALARETGASIMHVQDDFVDAEALRIIAASKVEFGVATVNDPERARDLMNAGVQQILTDDAMLLD